MKRHLYSGVYRWCVTLSFRVWEVWLEHRRAHCWHTFLTALGRSIWFRTAWTIRKPVISRQRKSRTRQAPCRRGQCLSSAWHQRPKVFSPPWAATPRMPAPPSGKPRRFHAPRRVPQHPEEEERSVSPLVLWGTVRRFSGASRPFQNGPNWVQCHFRTSHWQEEWPHHF